MSTQHLHKVFIAALAVTAKKLKSVCMSMNRGMVYAFYGTLLSNGKITRKNLKTIMLSKMSQTFLKSVLHLYKSLKLI